MSGGAWEYVMGVMQATATNGNPTTGPNATNNSGFKGPYSNNGENSLETGKEWPSSKYYDLYDYSSIDQTFQRGHLGDGTKEFGPFYQVSYNDGITVRRIGSYNADGDFFIYSGNPWFLRGGHFSSGTDSGIFNFHNAHGNAYITSGFRIVLAF